MLDGCTSRELTLWQLFLAADAKHQEQLAEERKNEAALKKWVNA